MSLIRFVPRRPLTAAATAVATLVALAPALTPFSADGVSAASSPLEVGISGVCLDDAVRFTLTGFAATPLQDVTATWTLSGGGVDVDTVDQWVGEVAVSADVPFGQTVQVVVTLPGVGVAYSSVMLLADAEQCGSIPEPSYEISGTQRCDSGTPRVAVEVTNTSLQIVSLDKQYWYEGSLLSTETVMVAPGNTMEFTASPAGSRLVFTPVGQPGTVLVDTGEVTVAICAASVDDPAGEAGGPTGAPGTTDPQLPSTGSGVTMMVWLATLVTVVGATLLRGAQRSRTRRVS